VGYNTSPSKHRPEINPRRRRRNENLHLEILRLVALGQRNKDIAKELGCSIRLVSKVKNDPELQPRFIQFVQARDQSLVNIDERIRRQITVAAEKSLARLDKLLDPVDQGGTDDPRVILQIAMETLTLCGFPAIKLSKSCQDSNPVAINRFAEVAKNCRE